MARENTVNLHGQIISAPKVYVKDGVASRGVIVIKTLRRQNGLAGPVGSKLYFDCPIIVTRNPDMIKQVYELEMGDMIDVKGALTTKEVDKRSTCPFCGAKNLARGNSVFITPIFICKRESHVSTEDGLRILKLRSEISNTITVIGTLCRDPDQHTDEKGRKYAQYQLAVNRKLRIKEDSPDIRTDYPWVKTFGNQALNDTEALKMGSVVYISGAIQTRDVKRTSICSECGKTYHWDERVTEIVPYSTEYLAGCNIPEKENDNGDIKPEE